MEKNKTYKFKEIEYDIDEILKIIASDKDRVVLDGEKIKVKSLRLKSFLKKQPCVSCGREGYVFRIATARRSKNPQWHLTLWSKDNIQMTKDHIVPKSKGGADTLNNIQTMCEKCNVKKGSDVFPEDFKKGEVVKDYNEDDYKDAQPNYKRPVATGLLFKELLNKYGNEENAADNYRDSNIGKMSSVVDIYGKLIRKNPYLLTEADKEYPQAIADGIIKKRDIIYAFQKEVIISYGGGINIHSRKMRMVPVKIRKQMIKDYKEGNL